VAQKAETLTDRNTGQHDTAFRHLLDRFRDRARALKRDTYALYLAARDPRTPWCAKLIAVAILAYALSPLDLIPDFIPVLGIVDDLIILPLGIAAVLKLVPAQVLADCRARADSQTDRPVSWIGAMVVVSIWLLVAVWLFLMIRQMFS
jgi:uncharacterized membrane protein YkvA (DUF1232 family)